MKALSPKPELVGNFLKYLFNEVQVTNDLPGNKTHSDTFPKTSEYEERRGKSFPKENKETLIYKELGII